MQRGGRTWPSLDFPPLSLGMTEERHLICLRLSDADGKAPAGMTFHDKVVFKPKNAI